MQAELILILEVVPKRQNCRMTCGKIILKIFKCKSGKEFAKWFLWKIFIFLNIKIFKHLLFFTRKVRHDPYLTFN